MVAAILINLPEVTALSGLLQSPGCEAQDCSQNCCISQLPIITAMVASCLVPSWEPD